MHLIYTIESIVHFFYYIFLILELSKVDSKIYGTLQSQIHSMLENEKELLNLVLQLK